MSATGLLDTWAVEEYQFVWKVSELIDHSGSGQPPGITRNTWDFSHVLEPFTG
jgi:hypothetical protein